LFDNMVHTQYGGVPSREVATAVTKTCVVIALYAVLKQEASVLPHKNMSRLEHNEFVDH
jgi:hypothetical protein